MVFTLQRMLDNGWKMKNVILMSVMVVVLLVIVSEVLLVFLQDVATDYELRWLVKFVLDEDVSNNRAPLYQQAWSGFLDSPLWGQGVATFNNFSGYPHNLFLQMLYETGILMIIPISFFILKAIKTIVIRNAANGYDYRFVTFFFLISMNQLMFSSYFWRNHCFWLMIWCIIGILYRKTQNNPQKLKY
jgi:O-antigen ligase